MKASIVHPAGPEESLNPGLESRLEEMRGHYFAGTKGLERFGMMWTACSASCALRNVVPSAPLLVLILHGEKLVSQEGGQESCRPGSLLLCPAQAPLGLINQPDEQGRYLALSVEFSASMIQSALERLPQGPDISAGSMPVAAWKALYASMLQMLEVGLLPGSSAGLVQVHGESLLHLLLSLGWGQLLAGQDALPVRVRMFLRKDLGHPWEMEEVAAALHMSARSLRRNLEASGTSLRSLLRQERLHAGLAMLQRGGHSVEEVAFACGYQSPSRFSRRFGEVFGISPGQVRLAGQPGKRGARLAV